MLALVMCLLVVGVAGVVLHDALRDGTSKRATVRRPTGRAPRRRRPVRDRGHHPYRSVAALAVSSIGIGLLLAVAGAVAAGVIALAIRAAVEND